MEQKYREHEHGRWNLGIRFYVKFPFRIRLWPKVLTLKEDTWPDIYLQYCNDADDVLSVNLKCFLSPTETNHNRNRINIPSDSIRILFCLRGILANSARLPHHYLIRDAHPLQQAATAPHLSPLEPRVGMWKIWSHCIK